MKRRRSRYCGYIDGAHVQLSKPWEKMKPEEQKAIRELIAMAKMASKSKEPIAISKAKP